MGKASWKTLLALHLLLMLYSCSSVLSKLASGYELFSPPFMLCYGGLIAFLGVYAVGWQQVIKRTPLTAAYANRAIVVVWGLVWGVVVFREGISLSQLIGCAMVVMGIVLFAADDEGMAQ